MPRDNLRISGARGSNTANWHPRDLPVLARASVTRPSRDSKAYAHVEASSIFPHISLATRLSLQNHVTGPGNYHAGYIEPSLRGCDSFGQ